MDLGQGRGKTKPGTLFKECKVQGMEKRDPSVMGGGREHLGRGGVQGTRRTQTERTHPEEQKWVWVQRPYTKGKAKKHGRQRADGDRGQH